jgi:protein-S-isoprenylcysteine O-methyltransferase Ste14
MNTLKTIQILIFVIVSLFIIYVSRKSLKKIKSHGFYRFFAFEFTAILVIINIPYWFENPFSLLQIISWIFLFLSIIVVTLGFQLLWQKGGNKKREFESANFKFEDTENLINTGIYKYIRHPMYSSLILLSLGVLFKNITLLGIILFVLVNVFVFHTAMAEEREDIIFFGNIYKEYMKKTKMFIPFVF